MSQCPICQQAGSNGNSSEFECPICGRYNMDLRLLAILTGDRVRADDALRPALAAYVCDENRLGVVPLIRFDNWESIAEGYAHMSVSTKLRRVLEYLEMKTKRAGETVMVDGRDYPHFCAQPSEVGFLARISDFVVAPYPPDHSSRPEFAGFRREENVTEGDTQWVNCSTSPFSSPSTGF